MNTTRPDLPTVQKLEARERDIRRLTDTFRKALRITEEEAQGDVLKDMMNRLTSDQLQWIRMVADDIIFIAGEILTERAASNP